MQTDKTESNEMKETHIILSVILFVLAITSTGFSSYHFIDMVTGFYNPEYGAMKNIVQFYQSVQTAQPAQ